MKFLLVSIIALLWRSTSGDICPDLSYCPGVESCCPSLEGYGCCPLPDAECCADLLHCCPDEYLCVVEFEICVKCPDVSANGCNSTLKYEAIKKTTVQSNVCPGQEGLCPIDTTCCKDSPGCCPFVDAVCCSDHLHCCPKGYTCNGKSGVCEFNDVSVPWFPTLVPKKVNNILCPDGRECPKGNSCCKMADGEYGCCQFADAVCCSDNVHCCPSGTTCDVNSGVCINEVHVIPWVEKKASIKRKL